MNRIDENSKTLEELLKHCGIFEEKLEIATKSINDLSLKMALLTKELEVTNKRIDPLDKFLSWIAYLLGGSVVLAVLALVIKQG